MKFFIQIILYLFIPLSIVHCSTGSSQKPQTLNGNSVLNNKEGVIYYVANDTQTIIAYKENKILWKTNIIKTLGPPYVGAPLIRDIVFRNDTIWVTYGKHTFAFVDAKTGKATFWGSD